jgi:hypothetical protein
MESSSRLSEARGSPTVASPTAGSVSDFYAGGTNPRPNRLSGGPSTESIRSLPYIIGNNLQTGQRTSYSSVDARSTSFSGAQANRDTAVTAVRTGSLGHAGRFGRSQTAAGLSGGLPSPSSNHSDLGAKNLRSKPPSMSQAGRHRFLDVYPALLSRVAETFRQHIPLSDRVKDGLSYKDAFDGKEALDLLCDIIRTPDRNLAMLVARSLESQKFFHEVTYGGYRFKDDPTELYRFKDRLPSPFPGAETGMPDVDMELNTTGGTSRPGLRSTSKGYSSGSLSSPITSTSASPLVTPQIPHETLKSTDDVNGQASPDYSSDDVSLPTGVFILLSACYSPTCSKDKLCYSPSCPRRADQQRRLNLKVQPALTRKTSDESLVEVKVSCFDVPMKAAEFTLRINFHRKPELYGFIQCQKRSWIV